MRRAAAIGVALALASCSQPEPPPKPAEAASAPLPPVEPPAPGTPGGLPDDRTPLPEGRVKTDDNQIAATELETYFALLESGRVAETGRQRTDGMPPDLSGYREFHAQIGRPGRVEGAAGSLFVKIPVSLFGRRADGAAFAQAGTAVMRRVNGVPGATPDQLRWRLERLEMEPEVPLRSP